MAKVYVGLKILSYYLAIYAYAGIISFFKAIFSGNPPLFFWLLGCSIIMCIPLMIFLVKDLRTWFLEGNEKHVVITLNGKEQLIKKKNTTGLILNLMSLLCAMIVSISYLNQVWGFPTLPFEDKAMLLSAGAGFIGISAVKNFKIVEKN